MRGSNATEVEQLRTEALLDDVLDRVRSVANQYHRLVLVVGPAGSGKSALLRLLCQREGIECLDVGLLMSRLLMDMAESERPRRVVESLDEAISSRQSAAGTAVVLDNLELLFDRSLKQDPLRLLQDASRRYTIIAAWSGKIVGGQLNYAEPGHREYRRYQVKDLTIVEAGPPTLARD
jgi:hypothetical protein